MGPKSSKSCFCQNTWSPPKYFFTTKKFLLRTEIASVSCRVLLCSFRDYEALKKRVCPLCCLIRFHYKKLGFKYTKCNMVSQPSQIQRNCWWIQIIRQTKYNLEKQMNYKTPAYFFKHSCRWVLLSVYYDAQFNLTITTYLLISTVLSSYVINKIILSKCVISFRL